MTFIMMVLGLVVWFFILRWLFRLVMRHPEQSLMVFKFARRLLMK
jgi:hypothetical protein